LDGYSIKLSSAGLIYKHFGKNIIKEILTQGGFDANKRLVDIFYDKIYVDFMAHIDAIDNGVSIADGPLRYFISTSLSARVGQLNPDWNQAQSKDIMNEQFKEAMLLTSSEFVNVCLNLAKSWWPARSVVEEAIKDRKSVDASGKVILMEKSCPWKDHIFNLEKEFKCVDELTYVVYGDSGGSWRIQAVPIEPTSFTSRKALPTEFRGMRDAGLDEKTGIPGGVFVHASGFIGGHKTKEGAIALAVKSLTM